MLLLRVMTALMDRSAHTHSSLTCAMPCCRMIRALYVSGAHQACGNLYATAMHECADTLLVKHKIPKLSAAAICMFAIIRVAKHAAFIKAVMLRMVLLVAIGAVGFIEVLEELVLY